MDCTMAGPYTAIKGAKMSGFYLRVSRTAIELIAALLACPAAMSFGAETQPAAAPPVAVRYSPPSHQTPLGTTFVDWDSLAVRFTPTGQSRGVFDNPTP